MKQYNVFYTSYAAAAFEKREPVLGIHTDPRDGTVCFSCSTFGVEAIFRIKYKEPRPAISYQLAGELRNYYRQWFWSTPEDQYWKLNWLHNRIMYYNQLMDQLGKTIVNQ